MNEIQGKRLENELQAIQTEKTAEIGVAIHLNDNKKEYEIDITIPKVLSLEEKDIALLLIVKPNYPFNPPRLFFKTNHFFPHLSDGRDMLEDVLMDYWSAKYRLIDIIEKIPKLIIEYANSLKQGIVLLSGTYSLGEQYDITFLENLPVFSKRLKERAMINGKPVDIANLLVISDLYFTLFEIDRKRKGNVTLTFWSHLRALITINRAANDALCKFTWRNQLEHQPMLELFLLTPDGEEIQAVILERLTKIGMNYNVNTRTSEAKTGPLPPTDICIIENQIEALEKEVTSKPTMELAKSLMKLYEDAVEFYSARDNTRYTHFTKKIHDLLNTPEMMKLITEDSNSQPWQSKSSQSKDTLQPLSESNISSNSTEEAKKEENSS